MLCSKWRKNACACTMMAVLELEPPTNRAGQAMGDSDSQNLTFATSSKCFSSHAWFEP